MQNSLDGERSLDLQEAYMKVMANRFFSVWKYPDFIYKWTAGYKKELELRRIYHETITCKLVDQVSVEEKLHTKDDMSFKTEETGKRIPENFIECLVKYLRAEGETSKDAVYPHIDMTVFAGNDTSAKTICSILLMLAIHPEVQERCYQELMEICPDKDQQISYKDAANLTYLEMVCKETMRLLPAVPLMARITTGDIKLNGKNFSSVSPSILIVSQIIFQTSTPFRPTVRSSWASSKSTGTRGYGDQRRMTSIRTTSCRIMLPSGIRIPTFRSVLVLGIASVRAMRTFRRKLWSEVS